MSSNFSAVVDKTIVDSFFKKGRFIFFYIFLKLIYILVLAILLGILINKNVIVTSNTASLIFKFITLSFFLIFIGLDTLKGYPFYRELRYIKTRNREFILTRDGINLKKARRDKTKDILLPEEFIEFNLRFIFIFCIVNVIFDLIFICIPFMMPLLIFCLWVIMTPILIIFHVLTFFKFRKLSGLRKDGDL